MSFNYIAQCHHYTEHHSALMIQDNFFSHCPPTAKTPKALVNRVDERAFSFVIIIRNPVPNTLTKFDDSPYPFNIKHKPLSMSRPFIPILIAF